MQTQPRDMGLTNFLMVYCTMHGVLDGVLGMSGMQDCSFLGECSKKECQY